MNLFAIADLHLSLGTDKPMDVFSGWSDYVSRLKNNWEKLVTDEDTVVIAGDISWAMRLEDCYEDFRFIDSLPGTKILSKGNHDYWWQTKKKIDGFLEENGFRSLKVLFNNAYDAGEFAVCGTRGWFYEKESDHDEKIINREIGRLRMSYAEAEKTGKEPVVFLHYPPVYADAECGEIMDALLALGVKKCYYGHLHGDKTHKNAVTGLYKGIDFRLISADFLRFVPYLVR